jgi:hypothetical protein
MPCWELFDRQPREYQSVLPAGPARGSRSKQERRSGGSATSETRELGQLDRFGASAPGEIVMRELGFSVENVVARAEGVAMKIAIGCDHAGFVLKKEMAAILAQLGHQVEDVGAFDASPPTIRTTPRRWPWR